MTPTYQTLCFYIMNLLCLSPFWTIQKILSHSLFAGINFPTPFAYPCLLHRCSIETQDNDHFKIIECCPTCRSGNIVSLGRCKGKCSTHIYCSDSNSECRGYHPEQLHQFHFRHPNITTWNIHSATFANCYNSSFHSYIAIEILPKD